MQKPPKPRFRKGLLPKWGALSCKVRKKNDDMQKIIQNLDSRPANFVTANFVTYMT